MAPTEQQPPYLTIQWWKRIKFPNFCVWKILRQWTMSKISVMFIWGTVFQHWQNCALWVCTMETGFSIAEMTLFPLLSAGISGKKPHDCCPLSSVFTKSSPKWHFCVLKTKVSTQGEDISLHHHNQRKSHDTLVEFKMEDFHTCFQQWQKCYPHYKQIARDLLWRAQYGTAAKCVKYTEKNSAWKFLVHTLHMLLLDRSYSGE
jgi:hypothetical protein